MCTYRTTVPRRPARLGVDQCDVRASLHDRREAQWDTDGTAGLEAQVMRDGMLVGYVPQIEGSEDFDEQQVVDAIARQRPAAAPAAPLPRRAACSAASWTASVTDGSGPFPAPLQRPETGTQP